tara:strand:- start:1639 stop:2682 length:1044 start_codon:yes stop_codon:yes gene_type:complete
MTISILDRIFTTYDKPDASQKEGFSSAFMKKLQESQRRGGSGKICLDRNEQRRLQARFGGNGMHQTFYNMYNDGGSRDNRLNRLLNSANARAACDSACQRRNRSAELKRIYDEKKENKRTAPVQLENARKAYYSHKIGTTNYIRKRTAELRSEIRKILKKVHKDYKDFDKNIKLNIKGYKDLLDSLINSKLFYKRLVELNKALERKLYVMKNDTSTDDRKVYYEQQGLDSLQWWQFSLRILYFCVVIAFILGNIFYTTSYSVRDRILVFVALLVYPFIIATIVSFTFAGVRKIFQLIPYNTYTQDIGISHPDINAGRKLKPVESAASPPDPKYPSYTDTLNLVKRPA